MKVIILVVTLAGLGSQLGRAQIVQTRIDPAESDARLQEYRVGERGPHHKVWESILYEPTMDGKLTAHRRSYVEMATGMHFKNAQGEWEESKEEIEILPNNAGAIAAKGQHKVIFPVEIKTGLIELQTPEGHWMRSRIWGLAYFDDSTGESVLLAEVKESDGHLSADNVVRYEDAFSGASATVCYIYTKSAFQQDIVLQEQPPGPEEFGLNPDSTRLQVLTEFVEAPTPDKSEQRVGGLSDERLMFGAMSMGVGHAFSADTSEDDLLSRVPVAKEWGEIEGRTFLVEEVLYRKVRSELEKLPKAKKYEGASLPRRGKGEGTLAALKDYLPRRYAKASQPSQERPKLMARVEQKRSLGFVLDYVTLNTTLTNYVFKGDTTYYISGTTYLKSNTVVEGGTCIKYNTSGAQLNLQEGTITFRTAPYRPAVFTSKNDNSVGETISGSTGSPSISSCTYIQGDSAPTDLAPRHVRFAYANFGVYLSGTLEVSDSQFVHCQNASYSYDASPVPTYRNVLLYDIRGTAISTDYDPVKVEHVTAHRVNNLFDEYMLTPAFTNCLFVWVTNWGGTFTSVNSATNSDSGTFQKVGGGEHYLADNTYRNLGTTNINADLLAGLRKRTTYPPIAYTNVTFTVPMTFNPQAQRDADIPDLGYHYDPLDYTFGGCHANSNMTFSAGTAVGWFRTSSGWQHAGHGIHLGDKQIGSFEGTASQPCYWVRLNTVQENDRTAGYGPGGMTSWAGSIANAAEVHARFTRCSIMTYDPWNHFRDDWGWLIVRANDCEFYGNAVSGYVISMYFTNCLFDRTSIAQIDGNGPCSVVLQNCTKFGGNLNFSPSQNSYYTVLDSAFADVGFNFANQAASSTWSTYDYNAYTNSTRPFPSGVGGTHDVTNFTDFNWQSSWLGDFYLPSNSDLIDEGSRDADIAGLYHFTTQTDQTRETDSVVDIGYHYVATDEYGTPIDSDDDGEPDYLEDGNGNGEVNSGETDPANKTDMGLKVWITRPIQTQILP